MPRRLLVSVVDAVRMGDALTTQVPEIAIVICASDGTLSLDGAVIAPEAAQPDIGWASGAVLGSDAARTFMVTLFKSRQLAWVQSASAGIDHPVFATLRDKGARITTSDAQAPAIADFVLWGVLDWLQRGSERRAAQATASWQRLPVREMAGLTWLIIGFGAIGQSVAQRVKGFGGQVIGVRRTSGDEALADRVIGLGQLRDHLPFADVVVLALPLTPATEGMVDANFLAALKLGSILVNVGRGAVLREDALLPALARGRPAHAILDVFAEEPLVPDHPYWCHPDITVSAHCAGLGDGREARDDALFLDNLGRFLNGAPLHNEAVAG